ncbi:MAG: hypothetical protein HY721_05610 [Planctomycetes bacterium]|nr:hypothetical protein [Planctomycetota bacterium]
MSTPPRTAPSLAAAFAFALVLVLAEEGPRAGELQGKFFRGSGDVEHLELLDTARRLFAPDPELPSLAMLYTPEWNGLVEGPTWNAWWIQNSFGTTYCARPYLEEPWLIFLQSSQDLWFDQMGDGKRAGFNGWVAPDGCLCDAARPGWIVYKQGDGRTEIHDWGLEFTAAGLLLQAELLLISRDAEAARRYLPRLERCAEFLETRRDPAKDLFLAGPAANLLAPSYAGWRRPDGTWGQAYLAGLSITYVAALDRLIELERLCGDPSKAALHARRRDAARKGLPLLTTEEGYFVKSVDPDGTRHGVYGAEKHGYFEASPNHDAIAFRVVGDAQAERIYAKMASIAGLRPHDFILPNHPSLDDMYEEPRGLWAFGTWVNGGHWSTCEARMILAYHRLGRHEDAVRSMRRLLGLARRFRLDNPLTRHGSDLYQPGEPINLTYDAFGPAAAFVRGLFEYLYTAEGLTLVPHVPPGITRLEQLFPIRLGRKRLWISTAGAGPVTAVQVNGATWRRFEASSVTFPHDETPDEARVHIALGPAGATAGLAPGKAAEAVQAPVGAGRALPATADPRAARLRGLVARLEREGLGGGYEAAHARLAIESLAVQEERRRLAARGSIQPLPEPSGSAAEKAFADAASRLCDGLEKALAAYGASEDPAKKSASRLWKEAAKEERIELFEDTGFRRGFHLAFPSTARGRAIEKVLLGADASAGPAWRLCQWATRISLAAAARRPVAGGAVEYEDATKRVVSGGGGAAGGPDLVLELRAGAEYEGRARAAGEPWPHLLVEQDATRAIPLDRLARLELDIDLRLSAFADRTEGRADLGLHAAQLQLFLIIKDVAPGAKGDFLWFGVPFFDSRQDFPPPHRARDGGKEDATGKLIYSLDGRDVLSTPLGRGSRVAVHVDLLPSIREALEYAAKHGFLESGDPARYAAVNMNLGWEMPGSFDAAAEIRGLAVTAVLPRSPGERAGEERAPGDPAEGRR